MSNRALRADLIVLDYAMELGVSVEDFTRRDKIPMFAAARRHCWARLSDDLGLSDGYIGRLFGGRTRQSILMGRKKHNANTV